MNDKIQNRFKRLACALALLVPVTASAFELKPMTETFEPSGRAVNRTFEVRNDLDEEVAVTMSVKARSVGADGVEALTDTKDFVVVPTEILLKGKATQVVRVRWQGGAVPDAERSYRIIAEQTSLKKPAPRPDGPSMAIKLVLRFGGTLYVAQPEAKADVVVSSAKAVKTAKGVVLDVQLENRGTRHAILDRPSLSLKSGAQSRDLTESDLGKALAGENILAGGKRTFRVPLPSGFPLGPLEAKLNASFLR